MIPPAAGAAAACALALAPGAALAWGLRRGGVGSVEGAAAALALSPGLLGAGTAALCGCGMALGPAGLFAVLGWMAVAAGVRAWTRPGAGGSGAAPPGGGAAAWRIALAAGAVCAAFPLASEWWRISSDAWTHEGIVRAIERGGLPPADPWFAGHALHYAWLYHVAVAALHAMTGVDRFALMAALAVVSCLAAVLAVAAAARRLGRGHVVATLVLLVLGLNALFPLFLPLQLVRAFIGQTRGAAAVASLFRLTPFEWDTVGPFLRGLGGQDFFLDKFLVATPLSLALAAYALWWSVLPRSPGDGPSRRSDLVLAALAVGLASALHPVVAIAAAVVLAAVATASFVPALGVARGARAWALASGVGLVPAAWYVSRFVVQHGGAHDALPVDVGPFKWLGLLSCTALGWVALGLRDDHGARGLRALDRTWAVALLAITALALVIRLPGPSSFFTVDKFAYLVWVPLALAAGPPLGAWLARRTAPAALALSLAVLVPVNALALASRIAAPAFAVRQPWQRPAFAWMRAHLPSDAVLVVPHGDIDIGVFAQRDQWYGLDADGQLRGLPDDDLRARRAALAELYQTGRPAGLLAATRTLAPRPVFVVWTEYRAAFWRATPGAWSARDVPRGAGIPGRAPIYADSDLSVTPVGGAMGNAGER